MVFFLKEAAMDQKIIDISRHLGELLQAQALKLTTAESCTGGGLAYAITEISGASEWFERGFVTYSDLAKIQLLHVHEEILTIHGAVSEKTAMAMALGALKHSHADIALSITGIAGPEGGSAEKPVGTVWFAVARKNKLPEAKNEQFSGDRHSIRQQAIQFALQWLIKILSEK